MKETEGRFSSTQQSPEYNPTVNSDKQMSYVLDAGHKSDQRLDLQQQIFRAPFIKAFQVASTMTKLEGASIVDFGCGASSAYDDIQTYIGPHGQYIGIDFSEEQVAFNKTKYHKAQYIVGNENSQNALDALSNADIIYLRFVIMHQREPKEFLKKIYNAAKSKAVLIFQEPEDTTECKTAMLQKYPFAGELCDIKSVIGKKVGLDYNIAKNLKSMLQDLDFKDMNYSAEQVQADNLLAQKLLDISLVEIHKKSNQILSTEELAHYRTLIEKLPTGNNDYWIFNLFHTVVAQKN